MSAGLGSIEREMRGRKVMNDAEKTSQTIKGN
jgi:hypothetical protein